jgi:hypothetical protein
MEKAPLLNKLIIHPLFQPTIETLKKENISLPKPTIEETDISN